MRATVSSLLVACSVVAAVTVSLVAATVATAAPPSDDFLDRWRAAERRFQVLDLQGYDQQMSALVPEAVGFDLREQSFFFMSAARAACLAGNPAYADLANAGLLPLTEDAVSDGGPEFEWLDKTLLAYSLGSASIVYEPGPRMGLREASGWAGTVASYFGARARGSRTPLLDLQAQDYGDGSQKNKDGVGEDYLVLAMTYCAGTHNQATVALPDLPMRIAPRQRVDGQAFGLNPTTKVSVTWRPCPRGVIFGFVGCDKRLARRQGMTRRVRRTITVTAESFSFKAPSQKGRWELTVKPIGQKAGRPRRHTGKTAAIVNVKPGKTRLRRDFVTLPD